MKMSNRFFAVMALSLAIVCAMTMNTAGASVPSRLDKANPADCRQSASPVVVEAAM